MGDEAEELLKHRFAIINLWRPISGPILESPLTLCDAQSLADEDLVIRCFDSTQTGAARFSAHTGFDDPTSPPDAPARESLEVRMLVFYPPEA